MKKILYVHGLSSSGASATAGLLRQLLPECTVLAPDLPVHPFEAIEMLTRLCETEQPQLVVGTSMGGMLAQHCRGRRKILINPAFHVSAFMQERMGQQPFLNPRADGATHYDITPELCEAYRKIETWQFVRLGTFDRAHTYGLFGRHDTLVDGAAEFAKHYPPAHAAWFDGGHRLDAAAAEQHVAPLARRLLAEAGEGPVPC